MMIKEKWESYAKIWALPADDRMAMLAEVAVPDVSYTDSNVMLSGPDAFSEYIANFQSNVPGGHFEITSAIEHHSQSLAHWKLLSADGEVLQLGTSYAPLNDDGKFKSFIGFFGGPNG